MRIFLILSVWITCCFWSCATPHRYTIQQPIQQSIDIDAVYFKATPDVEKTIEYYQGADGRELAYVQYPGEKRQNLAFVYLHGVESHAGWFNAVAEQLSQRGYDLYALDRRGSGINRENRSFTSGYVQSYEMLLNDIHSFLDVIQSRYDKIYLIGLSWGGKLALGYALQYPQNVDGIILITPGIHAKVDLPVMQKVKVFVASVFHPTSLIEIPIEPEMFTRTPAYLEYIENDPLRLHYATARFFYESWRLENYIESHIEQNHLPVLLFLAGQDRIIDNFRVIDTLRNGKQKMFDIIYYTDQTHSIQFDATNRLVDALTGWIEHQNEEHEQRSVQ